MATEPVSYAARLEIDYPEQLDRFTTFFRVFWSIPIIIIAGLVTGDWSSSTGDEAFGVSVVVGFVLATGLMILFRRALPARWFDFLLELTRFESRVIAHLLTSQWVGVKDFGSQNGVEEEVDAVQCPRSRDTASR